MNIKLSSADIVFLWLAGIWAVLVFADARIVYDLFGNWAPHRGITQNLKPVLGGWIPLALLWLTIRWAKK